MREIAADPGSIEARPFVEEPTVGLFSRKPKPRFPGDMLKRLELLGRFELDPQTSGIDAAEIYPTCVAPFFEAAQADPQAFLADLRAVTAHDRGGFARYGASCLVWEILSGHTHGPDASALLDDAIAFKRERGLSTAHLKGYEWDRWRQVHGPDGW